MSGMGAVAEMLRKRERRDPRTRISWWVLVSWLLVALAFVGGALTIPWTASRWLNALLWVALGALIMVLVVLTTRIAGRVLHRPAPSARMTLAYAFLMTTFYGVRAATPERVWGDQGLSILVQAVVTGSVVGLAQWLALRRRRRAATA
jgi:hypothetical protein